VTRCATYAPAATVRGAVLPSHELPVIFYSSQPFRVVDQGDLQSRCAEHRIERHCAHVAQRLLAQNLRRIAIRPAGDFVQRRIADPKLGQPRAEAGDEFEIIRRDADNARRVRALGRGGQAGQEGTLPRVTNTAVAVAI